MVMTWERNSVCWHVLLTTVLSMWIKYWLPHGTTTQHNTKATKTTWGYLFHREMFFPYNSFSLGFFKMSSARLGEDSCITNLSELPCNVDFNAGEAASRQDCTKICDASHLTTNISLRSLQALHHVTASSALTKESGHTWSKPYSAFSDSHPPVSSRSCACSWNSTLKEKARKDTRRRMTEERTPEVVVLARGGLVKQCGLKITGWDTKESKSKRDIALDGKFRFKSTSVSSSMLLWKCCVMI